jgi:vacuolar-type H+-ATPase subunit D/Vma8
MEEQRKAQKRVNALKYNIIPLYRRTIHFIQSALEEEERNTLFQVKVLRERHMRTMGLCMSPRVITPATSPMAVTKQKS